MTAKRTLVFTALSVLYWLLGAIAILTAAIGTCGMGPDATCSNGGGLSAFLAVVGFTLVYVAGTIWFMRSPKKDD